MGGSGAGAKYINVRAAGFPREVGTRRDTDKGGGLIQINPKFRDLIPPLSDAERGGLERSLHSQGCRDPLTVWKQNGSTWLIDGHNRIEICGRLKIAYQTREEPLADESEAKIWILTNQLNRRNLTDLSRIELTIKLADEVKVKAKASQIRKPKSVSAKLPKQNAIDTRAILASTAGVSPRTFDAGKLILEEGTEETKQAVRSGKTAIHKAAKEIRETNQKNARIEKRSKAIVGIELNGSIIVGDFREKEGAVPDGSVSLIFTDPPYDRKALQLIDDLGKFAVKKLADGGSLVAYVGHIQLPEALSLLSKSLRYWWTIACVHSGGKSVMREYGINAGWKPVVWFVKGTRHDNSIMVNDVMSGGQEKSHHEWQQAESEAAYWIDKLCPKDGLVCDPFIGGGTTAAAAKSLGRKWIGFEIDETSAKTASKRLAI